VNDSPSRTKLQADIQAYNNVPAGQADHVNIPALMQTCTEPGIAWAKSSNASISVHGKISKTIPEYCLATRLRLSFAMLPASTPCPRGPTTERGVRRRAK
jgi:hypothetical protein